MTTTYTPVPDVSDLLAYLSLTGANYDTAQAQAALDAAVETQAQVCVVEPFTAALAEAVLRRAQAILTARGAPLGQIDTGDFGVSTMLRYDPKIGELEAAYVRGAFA